MLPETIFTQELQSSALRFLRLGQLWPQSQALSDQSMAWAWQLSARPPATLCTLWRE
jgi:hypothetical protein